MKKIKKFLRMIAGQRGQSLIEVLIALGLAALIISSLTAAVLNALNNAQYSKNQNLASQYAQEGMEIIRKIKNTNSLVFSNYNGQYCLGQDMTLVDYGEGYGAGCGQNLSPFSRVVYIDNSCANSQKKVFVWVFWSDNKCTDQFNPFCHKATSVSCFSDSSVVPSP